MKKNPPSCNAAPSLREQILILADTMSKATGLSIRQISVMAFNDHNKILRIRGGADLATRSYESALQFFSDNWPAIRWPAGVKRPQKSQQVA